MSPREFWGSTSWKLRIWKGRINFLEGWSRASPTHTASYKSATSCSRAKPSRRASTPNGMKFSRWQVWDIYNIAVWIQFALSAFINTDNVSTDSTCRSEQASTCCVHQALVYEHSGQHLEIEVFDEDPDKDDFLGRWVSFFPALLLSYHTSFRGGKVCCTALT